MIKRIIGNLFILHFCVKLLYIYVKREREREVPLIVRILMAYLAIPFEVVSIIIPYPSSHLAAGLKLSFENVFPHSVAFGGVHIFIPMSIVE